MPVDKFGRSPKTGQNVTNVSGDSHEYVNSNFLRKGQATDMSGQSIVNLGSSQGPKDAVRKKYVNKIFSKRKSDRYESKGNKKRIASNRGRRRGDERLRRLEKSRRK